MNKRIRITAGTIELTAELNETKTAQAVWAALPIKGEVNRWGDEIYFSIPLKLEAENTQELVSSGDLGYWPPGNAFCIFFGPTPMSQGDEIRPASAVNIFGKISSDTKGLEQVNQGAEIIIMREA